MCLDAAHVHLGQASLGATAGYAAQLDLETAAKVAAAIGQQMLAAGSVAPLAYQGIDTVPSAVTLPLGVMFASARARPLMPMMMPVKPSTRAPGFSPTPPTRMES
jgi:hypothetical protein